MKSITLYHDRAVNRIEKMVRNTRYYLILIYIILFIVEPLRDNCESQSELRFVQARITSFSLYAVICRLKSYTFSSDDSVKSPEFTCQVPEYPDMSVTIPRRSFPKDVKLTMKVRGHYLELKTCVARCFSKRSLINHT